MATVYPYRADYFIAWFLYHCQTPRHRCRADLKGLIVGIDDGGTVTYDFTSFSTVFQAYQDDGTLFAVEKVSPTAGWASSVSSL